MQITNIAMLHACVIFCSFWQIYIAFVLYNIPCLHNEVRSNISLFLGEKHIAVKKGTSVLEHENFINPSQKKKNQKTQQTTSPLLETLIDNICDKKQLSTRSFLFKNGPNRKRSIFNFSPFVEIRPYLLCWEYTSSNICEQYGTFTYDHKFPGTIE